MCRPRPAWLTGSSRESTFRQLAGRVRKERCPTLWGETQQLKTLGPSNPEAPSPSSPYFPSPSPTLYRVRIVQCTLERLGLNTGFRPLFKRLRKLGARNLAEGFLITYQIC